MLNVQKWLEGHSRDIIDESDHILAVKQQLIYPNGAQSTVNSHPARWKTAQALLAICRLHLPQLRKDYPQGVELLDRTGGGFPVIYLQSDSAKDTLLTRVTTSVLAGAGGILPVKDCSPSDLKLIEILLRTAKLSKDIVAQSADLFKDRHGVRKDLLLCRGLLVHRILLHSLTKRWNVQYELHPTRDPIAVPYHAKMVPSEQAEFGHPDVAILLTCLSFYYQGLDLKQLQETLKALIRADDPSLEYTTIVQQSPSLPQALRAWVAINVDDDTQGIELLKHLRWNTILIDYYMNAFAFPRHAKTFQKKLVSSGWDIPLIRNVSPIKSSKSAATSSSPVPLTTGFSGTNDNRLLLPMTIQQGDLPELLHTNAEVLTYLLEDRNRHVAPMTQGLRRMSERDLLESMKARSIRVLVDSGAQILELNNRDLIRL
jgi:hypothetical protein